MDASTFKVTRVYTDAQGDSRFEDIFYPLEDAGPIGFLSKGVEVREIVFRKVPPGYDYAFHNAPRRQYIVLLDVGVEIETSTGEKRAFQAGEVILVEDISGKGHRTRNLEEKERSSVFVVVG